MTYFKCPQCHCHWKNDLDMVTCICNEMYMQYDKRYLTMFYQEAHPVSAHTFEAMLKLNSCLQLEHS